MSRFCIICGDENGTHQMDFCEPGTTVMYLIEHPYVFGFATVVSKYVVEHTTLINGEAQEEPEMDLDKSYINVVPYGCKVSNEVATFKLHICEFMRFSPDDEFIEDQMEYTYQYAK